MCGNVGIAGNLLYQDEFVMKRMLLADYFRGEHSTGMAAIRANGDAIVAKIASNPIDLFGTKQFSVALNGNASRAFIGHNRQATRGLVNTVNAHPFHFDHIVGCHNGTLDYESVHRLEEELGEKYAVDSMAIIAGIAKFGVKKTIELCNEGKDGKDGAWALVWFDQVQGTLNFLRNKHRTLYYCFEEGFKRMLWASEWWMMREALESSPNPYKIYNEKMGDKPNVGYFDFTPDVHYSFDLAVLAAGGKKRPKPKCTTIKGREKKEVGYGGSVPFDQWPRATSPATNGTHTGSVGTQNSTPKTRTSSVKRHGTTSEKKDMIVLQGTPDNPYAGILSNESYAMAGYKECSWCKGVIPYGQLGVSIYEKEARILCKTCSGNSQQWTPVVRIYVRPNIFEALS